MSSLQEIWHASLENNFVELNVSFVMFLQFKGISSIPNQFEIKSHDDEVSEKKHSHFQ